MPNNEQAVLSIGGQQFPGTLCLVSATGGTIRLANRFKTGTFAEIAVKTVSGRFTATIELLQMRGGNVQAFRFVQMGAVARKRLEDALNKMRAQGLGIEKPNTLKGFVNLARRVLSSNSTK